MILGLDRRAKAAKAANLLLGGLALLGVAAAAGLSPARAAAVFSAATLATALFPKAIKRKVKYLRGSLVDLLLRRDDLRQHRSDTRKTARVLGLPTAGYQAASERHRKEFERLLKYGPWEVLERLASQAEERGDTDTADFLKQRAREVRRSDSRNRIRDFSMLPRL